MGGFSVELDALTAVRERLAEAQERLGGALTALGEAAAGPLGTDDLDAACDEFRQSWSHGLGKLGECVEAVGAGIESTRARYAENETVVAASFGGAP